MLILVLSDGLTCPQFHADRFMAQDVGCNTSGSNRGRNARVRETRS
jgi:hypothetical protein